MNFSSHPRVRNRNHPGEQLSSRCERLLLQPLLHDRERYLIKCSLLKDEIIL